MIKHFITIFLFLSIIAKINASEITMDRVDSLLANKDIQDQENILDSLLMKYSAVNPTIGLKLSKRYACLVEGSNDTYKRGISKYYLGLSYEMIGEFDKSLEYLFGARDILIDTEFKKKLASVYNEIGLVYYEQQNEELKLCALEYFNKFLELSLIIDDKMEIAGAYSNIGMVYSSLNKLDSSLKYHNKALKMRLELNDERTIGISYANIGNLKSKLGDYGPAISYYEKAVSLYKKDGYTFGLHEAYSEMASLYFEKQEFDKAVSLP
jgi:tetratricopeptide (TPR) repeat protein